MSDFGLTEADFKGKPGYWQRPKKVRRPLVGMVDGYEWGYRAPKVKRTARQISSAELGEMLKPCIARTEEKAALDMAARQAEVLVSASGLEYVPPEQAAAVAARTGWRARPYYGRFSERTVYHADGTTSVMRSPSVSVREDRW